MSEAPLVSVAVVTFNQRDFLDECLLSILDQDYRPLEIVVADDGSTDGTDRLLDDYARDHPGRFVILRAERNQGVTANQDLALSGCRGKYIAWIAGDDLMLPGKISAQVAFMEANSGCNICYHDLELFDSDSGKTLCRTSDYDRQRTGGFATLVRHGHFNGAVSSMVRRSASPATFDRSIPVASDWLYYIECLTNGGTINPIPGVLGRYRRHANNVTGSTGRSQPFPLFVEHLQSCAVIIAKWPAAARHVRFRASKLLLMQRWCQDGARYRDYLRASLAVRFSPAVFAALIANILFGVRR